MREKAVTRETGDLMFFYRPKPELDAARSADDVEELLLCLNPDGGRHYRLLHVPDLRMPSPFAAPEARGRVAHVQGVYSREDLRQVLMAEDRIAWTGNEPFIPPARPAADARYGLFEARGQTYFALVRELPRRAGPVQQALGIPSRALYVLWLENPSALAPPPEPLPALPAEVYAEAGRAGRMTPVEPEWLDVPGVGFLFVGAGVRPEARLGIRFHPDPHRIQPPTVLAELHYARGATFMEPLRRGRWR